MVQLMRTTFAIFLVFLSTAWAGADDAALSLQFANLKPTLQKFCITCHSTDQQEGELDLERFSTLDNVRANLKLWPRMIQQLKTREMPPKDQLQPTDAQREQLIDWVRQLLDHEALSRAGERGLVPLHRLSNAEYDNVIRDLTGVDLGPTREFPADGAAGEGFTNAAEALGMSPALMTKYVAAAKQIADHAVLLPDGFRFSKSATRRDWTDESLAELRSFYRQFSYEGSLPLKPYLVALAEHRDDLNANRTTIESLAKEKRLSPKYLATLWQTLDDSERPFPMDRIRALWNAKPVADVDAIVAEVNSWFDRLWEFPKIGSYTNTHRQRAKDPTFRESNTFTIKLDPESGQNEVVLYLLSRSTSDPPVNVLWDNPRFAAPDLPTLSLCDYESFGPQYEVDYAKLFGDSQAYLAAVHEAAWDSSFSIEQLAAKHNVNVAWLERWIVVADLKPNGNAASGIEPGRNVSAVGWQLLDELAPNPNHPAVNGWRPKGAELPILITNSSDQAENVPGRMSPRSVAVHPTPTEFVAAVWKSPIAGRVSVSGKIIDAHSSCGNGVAWWLEKQSPTRSSIISEGTVDLGKSTQLNSVELNVAQGDHVLLAVDAREASHVCDLTEIVLTIREVKESGRRWDLASDIASDVTVGNPHSDSYGNRDVWSFVKGAAKDRPAGSNTSNGESILSRWRSAASMPKGERDAAELASQLQKLLVGMPPTDKADPNRVLYDRLVSFSGPLLRDIDAAKLSKPLEESRFGLPKQRFGNHPAGKPVDPNTLVVSTDQVLELRLPAALFRDYQFVVDGKLDAGSDAAAVQLQVLSHVPGDLAWDASLPVVANAEGQKRFLAGIAEFRRIFPPNICYPHIIPLDEVVCLKTFHREDEPLRSLFLDETQTAELERLWNEHRFITKFPIVENEYLPLFIGFVTQDQPKELVQFFEDKRPEFQSWADEFETEFDLAAPKQMELLFDFASRAYRRPLLASESRSLETLYRTLREKGTDHEDAFRSLISRVLMSPSFLLQLEQANGTETGPANDWQIASRMSFFLWGSIPDDELLNVAASGKLSDTKVLAKQTQRMLKDDRVRSLAMEFGTQWLGVRGFDQYKDKNEKLFPAFDSALRTAMHEESIQIFRHLFQNNGPVADLVDADYTFLNETLAKHYGIAGIVGPDWRRVDDVQKHGRGGILGLASVQTKQAGASRTSPILRGNWVVETLLGERLPQPPPNVPQLPESEIGNGGLTMREITRRHVSAPQCASCHQRIDPFGLALEAYDPIGRRRDKDLGGLVIDASAKLADGTEFDDINGLRQYLVTHKKNTIIRLFYQRLLGYALRRSVSISDQVLLDEMMVATHNGDAGINQAIIKVVQSPQFRSAGDPPVNTSN